jgi:hypothetical protein
MPIELDEGRERVPSMKPNRIGERFIGAIVRFDTRQARDYDSRELLWKKDAQGNDTDKPVNILIIRAIAVEGDMQCGTTGDLTPVVPGDEVNVVRKGGGWSDWIEGKNGFPEAHGRRLRVGDLVTLETTHGTAWRRGAGTQLDTDEAVAAAKADRSVTVGVYARLTLAPAVDLELVERCEARHLELRDQAIDFDARADTTQPSAPVPIITPPQGETEDVGF